MHRTLYAMYHDLYSPASRFCGSAGLRDAAVIIAERMSAAREAAETKRKRKRERRKKRSRSHASFSSSASASSDAESDAEGFRGARRTTDGALRSVRIAKRTPGRLLDEFMRKLMGYLAVRGEASEGAELPPVVTAYLTTVLLPSMTGETKLRMTGELRALAEAVDLFVKGKFAEGCGTLVQRFKCVELASSEGWSVARRLGLTASATVSSVPQQERAAAVKRQASEQRTNWLAAQSQGRGGRGGNGR